MSDDDPTLTPEQEREVRRLLADARHFEPLPDDVAARLDRVLVELAAGAAGEPSAVTDLAARRRQRVVTLLVAAAAVVVLGIGLGQVIGTRGGSDAGADRAGSGAEAGAPPAGASRDKNDSGEGDSPGDAATLDGLAASQDYSYALAAPAEVDPSRFSHDVVRLRKLAGANLDAARTPSASVGQDKALRSFSLECQHADWGSGTFVPVIYAGDPAVLIFRRAVGDTQVVDLFQCGSTHVIRSITLPAP